MKILYIANSRIPTEKAHGLQIITMCNSFVNNGLDLELILPTRKNLIKDNIFDYYKINRNFKIKKLFIFDPTFFLKFPAGTYIKFQSFFFIIKLFFYFLTLKNRKKMIVYTRDEYLLPVLQLFFKKVYYECHNVPKNIKYHLKYWYKCQQIITITKGVKEKLISIGLAKEKILVCPDGVDLDKFNIPDTKEQARQKLNLPTDKNLIIYTGHLYEWKGAQILAQVAQYLNNNEVIVFVGGSTKDVIQFKEKYTKDNILILGYQEHSTIPLYLKAADILVLPNSGQSDISRLYTSPMKLFEYLASKRPIIASKLPSIEEILNNSNSVLVDPDSPELLAKAIKILLSDTNLSDKLAQQAFLDVQEYTWDNRAKKIINSL